MSVIAAVADQKTWDDEIKALRHQLVLRGMFVRIGKRFDKLVDQIEACPDRSALHEQFDPSGDMDGAVDAFWMSGFDEDGNLIHTQAAHLLDLTDETVSGHLAAHIDNYMPKSPPLVRSSIRAMPGPKASKISGMVAYHGEMWLRKDCRDQATAALVIRLGLLLMMREWNPDAVFGLMNWSLACQGFNMRIGYHHSEPMTLVWERSDNGREHQVWLVYLEREDIEFLTHLPAVEFSATLARRFA